MSLLASAPAADEHLAYTDPHAIGRMGDVLEHVAATPGEDRHHCAQCKEPAELQRSNGRLSSGRDPDLAPGPGVALLQIVLAPGPFGHGASRNGSRDVVRA